MIGLAFSCVRVGISVVMDGFDFGAGRPGTTA
jgi:hypothetical protein